MSNSINGYKEYYSNPYSGADETEAAAGTNWNAAVTCQSDSGVSIDDFFRSWSHSCGTRIS